MVKLFSYGTLIDKEVQLREFGQELFVEPDLVGVRGFEIDRIEIEGEFYYCAVEKPNSIILGQIVHIPEDLMDLVDEYEGEDYKRVSVTTLFDVECLIYVKR